MPQKQEQMVLQPTILLKNDNDGGYDMVVRVIGQDERTILKTGVSCRLQVPYLGLIVGYVEKKGK